VENQAEEILRSALTHQMVAARRTLIVTDTHACTQRWTPANVPAVVSRNAKRRGGIEGSGL